VVTYLAAADDQDAFIPNLPCQYQGAAALNLWVGSFHGAESVAEMEQACSAEIAMSTIPRHCQGRAEEDSPGWRPCRVFLSHAITRRYQITQCLIPCN
jgi:hypothetical protein